MYNSETYKVLQENKIQTQLTKELTSTSKA